MPTVTSIHMALPDGADNAPPEWIHLTPAGKFSGKDGRGPFVLKDPAGVISRSMRKADGKIVVDINHSTHVAAPRGKRSDAVGWITELNAREDGIWGRVKWNGTGHQLMVDHAYRGISPAIGSEPDGTILWIEAVSLTNSPNLGVTTLHSQQNQETRMDLAQLRRTLGLSETATEDDINAAIARGKAAVTLHASVAKAVGLKDDASEDAVLAAVKEKSVSVSTHAQGEISTLQSQIADQNKTIADLKGQMAKAASESWMDKLRTEKFVDEGTRSDLVTLHMQNPDMAEKIAKSLQDIPKAGVTLHMRQRGGTGGAADPSLTKMDEAFGLDPEKKD